jgi:hypothetical protein
MERIDIVTTKKEHLSSLYKHLSVQSLLDIKAVNGEVTEAVLLNLLYSSIISKTVLFSNKVAYSVFVMPTDIDECSVFLVSTTLGYSNSKSLDESFSDIIKDLPDANFYSIVYKGNHRYAKLLKDNGFRFIRNLIHGVEKRNFLLLGKMKDDTTSS